MGLILAIIGIFIEGVKLSGYEPACTLNGFFFVFLGYLIKQYKSRSICVLAMIYSLVGVFVPLLNLKGHSIYEWGMGVALILLVLSISVFKASLKYHRFFCSKVILKNVIQKSILSIIYTSMVLIPLSLMTSSLNDVSYKKILELLIVILVFLPTILSFRGWLPFTKNKPLVYSLEKPKENINILQAQNPLAKNELLIHKL